MALSTVRTLKMHNGEPTLHNNNPCYVMITGIANTASSHLSYNGKQ